MFLSGPPSVPLWQLKIQQYPSLSQNALIKKKTDGFFNFGLFTMGPEKTSEMPVRFKSAHVMDKRFQTVKEQSFYSPVEGPVLLKTCNWSLQLDYRAMQEVSRYATIDTTFVHCIIAYQNEQEITAQDNVPEVKGEIKKRLAPPKGVLQWESVKPNFAFWSILLAGKKNDEIAKAGYTWSFIPKKLNVQRKLDGQLNAKLQAYLEDVDAENFTPKQQIRL